jgi:hypothetical protein
MDNLKWNVDLIRSDMKGLFRRVEIVWFDRYEGVSRMDQTLEDFGEEQKRVKVKC